MRIHSLFLGAAALTVTVLLYEPAGANPSPSGTTPASARPATPFPRLNAGHLIVQIEGRVDRLGITWITPKADAHNPRYSDSLFSLVQLDIQGEVLDQQPIDLSRFNLDVRKPGLRVEGCEVIDSQIATICNIPYLPQTRSLEIRNRRKTLARLRPDAYAALLRKGQNR